MSRKPVLKAWIFGSFARGEEKAQSNIDILFVPDFEHGSFTLLTHGGMYEDLKQLLGVKLTWLLMALCVRMLRRVWNEIKSWYMRELVREFNASHPEIPWKQVEGMRHVLVHGYSQVLPRILWATAKENIPEIKAQVEKYLNETDWEHYCGE